MGLIYLSSDRQNIFGCHFFSEFEVQYSPRGCFEERYLVRGGGRPPNTVHDTIAFRSKGVGDIVKLTP